jgi:short-subunit dehydrogenase
LDQFRYGYVLVTGATDGIGKAISREFLRRGFKVLMVSRNLEKLKEVHRQFDFEYPGCDVQVVSADFSKSHRNTLEFYQKLAEELDKFDISVVVNNVGFTSVKMLNSENWENIENMLGVNIYPSTMITHRLIQRFLCRFEETRQKSLVINISSLMEESIFPGNSVYAATKRYNTFFSEGLRYEYQGKVLFATVKPGLVTTATTRANNTSDLPMSTDPDTFACGAIGGEKVWITVTGNTKSSAFLTLPPYFITIFGVRMLIGRAVKKGLLS